MMWCANEVVLGVSRARCGAWFATRALLEAMSIPFFHAWDTVSHWRKPHETPLLRDTYVVVYAPPVEEYARDAPPMAADEDV